MIFLSQIPYATPFYSRAVLVGAGDISSCDNHHDEATAKLLDAVAGVVFALGDNVYIDGSHREFSECYHST